MNGRIERVEDDAEREELRAKARSIRARALFAASLVTIATLFLR